MKSLYKRVAKIFSQTKIDKYTIANVKEIQQIVAHQQLIKEEIAKVKATFKNRPKPNLPELVKKTDRDAIWHINLANKTYKTYNYMKLHILRCVPDSYIVYADTEIFYLFLLEKELSSAGQDKAMEACRLYRYKLKVDNEQLANQRFLDGLDRPIPLDVLNASIFDLNLDINFVDGMTRTIWLIANYAESFPILANGLENAKLLNDIVGLTDHPIPVKQLIS